MHLVLLLVSSCSTQSVLCHPHLVLVNVCSTHFIFCFLLHEQAATPKAPYYMLCKEAGTAAARPTATLTCGLQCCGRHLNGFADRPPVRPNMSLGDTLAGLHAAFGVVMALLHRQRHQNKVPGQVGHLSQQLVNTLLLYDAFQSFQPSMPSLEAKPFIAHVPGTLPCEGQTNLSHTCKEKLKGVCLFSFFPKDQDYVSLGYSQQLNMLL